MPREQAGGKTWRARLITILVSVFRVVKAAHVKKWFWFSVVVVWQAFRAYLFIWFLIFLVLFLFVLGNAWRFAGEPIEFPKTACGKLAGTVIEVPRNYLFFSPSYEGESQWEKGYAKNKKGCGANFETLNLDAHWPGMFPAGWIDLIDDKIPGHIDVALSGINDESGVNLPIALGLFLERARFPLIPVDSFDEALGLFHMRGFESGPMFSMRDIYWVKEPLHGFSVIECTTFLSGPYSCKQRWYFSKLKIFVSVSYRPELLRYWAVINKDVESFIVRHVK